MELLEKLADYAAADVCPMHMPGHKRRDMGGGLPWQLDITEIDGFDNLHDAQGVLKDGMDRAARLYGSRRAFFLVGGSTCGILAGICAATRPGDTVLLPRGCHKSVYHALELRDLKPVYLPVPVDDGFGVAGSLRPETVAAALEAHPEAKLVIVTSPTYEGVVSDVAAITALAHRAGVPVLVDEAHGAHLGLAPWLPSGAVAAGADLVIQSAHKTLPSLTQTALAHWSSALVPAEELARQLAIFETSSPSYILMSSLDACVAKLEKDSGRLFDEFTENLEAARRQLGQCRYIRLLQTPEETGEEKDERGTTEIFDYDRSKLILSTLHSSLNGPELAGILRRKYHLEVEMTTENYVLALAAVGDTREGFRRLCKAIEEIDRQEAELAEKSRNITEKIAVGNSDYVPKVERQNCIKCNSEDCESCDKKDTRSDGLRNKKYACKCGHMKQLMSISRAMDAPSQLCLLEESAGKIAAEFVYLYPPGIPIIVPGEQITGLFTRNVRRYMEQGLNLHGLCGENNETISVVKEQAEV